ncbi:PrsW family intramembrane metalloprotease [Patescibacteria group bacterium]
MIFTSPIFYAILGGFVPAFIWLFFWLREDEHPEPKRILALAFIAGIFSIPLAIFLEWGWQGILKNITFSPLQFTIALFVGFAFIEEISKYVLAKKAVFWRRDFDEPVDAMIYLITAALGFASVENVLYLSEEFNQSLQLGISAGNLRFIGATLLHALSSGILGYFVAHSFCRGYWAKVRGLIIGLFSATALHAAFNFFILSTGGDKLGPVLILLGAVGVLMLFAFEHIKRVHGTCTPHSNKAR